MRLGNALRRTMNTLDFGGLSLPVPNKIPRHFSPSRAYDAHLGRLGKRSNAVSGQGTNREASRVATRFPNRSGERFESITND